MAMVMGSTPAWVCCDGHGAPHAHGMNGRSGLGSHWQCSGSTSASCSMTTLRDIISAAYSAASAAEPDYRGLATAASSLAVAAKALASAAPRGGDGKFLKVRASLVPA